MEFLIQIQKWTLWVRVAGQHFFLCFIFVASISALAINGLKWGLILLVVHK